jgi:hypothetical protein
VCQNFLLVVLDASLLLQSVQSITVVPEAVKLLEKVFGTFVSKLLALNFEIITSVSQLVVDGFCFGASISELSHHGSCFVTSV